MSLCQYLPLTGQGLRAQHRVKHSVLATVLLPTPLTQMGKWGAQMTCTSPDIEEVQSLDINLVGQHSSLTLCHMGQNDSMVSGKHYQSAPRIPGVPTMFIVQASCQMGRAWETEAQQGPMSC